MFLSVTLLLSLYMTPKNCNAMSFCQKGVHSFLGFDNNYSMDTAIATSVDDNPPFKHGLGLITGTGDEYFHHRTPYVTGSSFLKLLPPPPPPPTPPLVSLPSVFSKKDPGGIGFIDDTGGGVNGLMSCTESLGFESSDERTVDDHQMDELDVKTDQSSQTRAKWKRDHEVRREMKKFPPPLSCFNRNGQPSFFLRSVRTDGRLELTEVRIDRREILRASREDGRLRLHLIRDEDEDDEDDLDVECENVEQDYQQEEEEEEELQQDEEHAQEDEEQEQEEEDGAEEGEEDEVGEWKLEVSGPERVRRCNEMVSHHHHHHHHDYHLHQSMGHHHHHNLQVWRQCVPTR